VVLGWLVTHFKRHSNDAISAYQQAATSIGLRRIDFFTGGEIHDDETPRLIGAVALTTRAVHVNAQIALRTFVLVHGAGR
jgi:hypothetical protein